jgi:hypothetical protein
MHIALLRHDRLRAAAAFIPATLAAILAGYLASSAGDPGPTVPAGPDPVTITSTSVDATQTTRIVLRVSDGRATATLVATPAARQLAAMLPLRLTLRDAMGQAKTGQLPHRIDVSGVRRVIDPDVAAIYYWPPGGDIGIYYDDLGQTVPLPGMVRLGSVDGGLDAIASAGNRFTVWIG